MPGLIERQVIVTWYTPEERPPEEDTYTVVTFSGHYKNITYDHALGIATWADDGCGWLLDGAPEGISFTVHAWADLEPYKGGERHD